MGSQFGCTRLAEQVRGQSKQTREHRERRNCQKIKYMFHMHFVSAGVFSDHECAFGHVCSEICVCEGEREEIQALASGRTGLAVLLLWVSQAVWIGSGCECV